MNISLVQLRVITRQSTELVVFSPGVTFIHGPVGTGKSTMARLIDFCFGARLEKTPAVQMEFVAAQLSAQVGNYAVQFERAATDGSSVRVTWEGPGGVGSINAPLDAGEVPILGQTVFNLSDLIFFLAGVEPIKVRKSRRDPDSPLVRLSFRDVLWYCYLKQERLDSSFFRLEDTFKRLKSMDVMRFVTGLHSDRLNELDAALVGAQDEQRGKREAVEQIRKFLRRFQLGSEVELMAQIHAAEQELGKAAAARDAIEHDQSSSTHVVEPMRIELRRLSAEIERERVALLDVRERIEEQRSLRSELITAKVKAGRVDTASSVLAGVEFDQCPRCGAHIDGQRQRRQDACYLCGTAGQTIATQPPAEAEALRQDLNSRIDDLEESIARHERELARQERKVNAVLAQKVRLDAELGAELARYDSAFVANVRAADRTVATLQERIASLQQLARMPTAIQDLEREAGELQGEIGTLRSSLAEERERLRSADTQIQRIEDKFFAIMREVGFPGVDERDRVTLDPRNWMPMVVHGETRTSCGDSSMREAAGRRRCSTYATLLQFTKWPWNPACRCQAC